MDARAESGGNELWATFSVKDHCRRGAFLAEVLLYDKLLLPVMPTAEDGLTPKEVAKEEERWKKWDPERQETLIEVLAEKGRVECVPWTPRLQDDWRDKMNDYFAAAKRDGYFMTGEVMKQFAPAMATKVVAVSAYHSLDELKQATGIRRREPHEELPGSTLMAVLGEELLVPDDPNKSEVELLREAVEVSSDPAYREKRRSLYAWQQKFLQDGKTDAASIKAALQDMRAQVDELRAFTNRGKWWRRAQRSFKFVAISAAVAPFIGGPVAVVLGAAGLVAAVGEFVAEPRAERAAGEKREPQAAALVLDAREKLGIQGV